MPVATTRGRPVTGPTRDRRAGCGGHRIKPTATPLLERTRVRYDAVQVTAAGALLVPVHDAVKPQLVVAPAASRPL
ncbi:hypothetical protein GCM10009828_077310 [Actinoplanes couchii]|uniref:Uncharacterized protein n=1 Tax=Actinoplanes couchii TaxID=403638 RepID=A0ABQ3XF39_9ACTN|nr:hypothetical protein Aco03nite_055140 [Actinoplanes couchii]